MKGKEALKKLCLLGQFKKVIFEQLKECVSIIKQDLDRLEKLKKDLKYLATQKVERFQFPNGREILGIDITNCPSNVEIFNSIIQAISKEVLESE